MKRRYWLILALAFVLWFSLKNRVYQSVVNAAALPEQAAADYQSDDGWTVLPIEVPPGAWNDPWGVDLFVIAPPSGAKAGKGFVGHLHPGTLKDISRSSHQISDTFAPAGPSYSPIYRHPSASMTTRPEDWNVAREDVAMAFERYLYSRNNWRGILLVAGPETLDLLPPLLDRIHNDPRLIERFSGLVVLQSEPTPPSVDLSCSPAMNADCLIVGTIEARTNWMGWLLPQLPRQPIEFEFSDGDTLAQTLAARNTKLSIWLDKNAAKPAEPLGGLESMEVIEIAPIRRPGETDEVIAKEDGEN